MKKIRFKPPKIRLPKRQRDIMLLIGGFGVIGAIFFAIFFAVITSMEKSDNKPIETPPIETPPGESPPSESPPSESPPSGRSSESDGTESDGTEGDISGQQDVSDSPVEELECGVNEWKRLGRWGEMDECILLRECDTEEYEYQEPTATSDRVCETLTQCNENQYVSSEPTDRTDRVCDTIRTPCGEGEYESQEPVPGHTNRVCETLTQCNENQYEFSEPVPGQTNRVCRDLTPCSPSQYISNPGRANNEDVVCEPISPLCREDEYESQLPVPGQTDRVCSLIEPCGEGKYESAAASPGYNRVCTALTQCNENQYESRAPEDTEDRVCTALTQCNENQYESQEPVPGHTNRICQDLTQCNENQYELSEPVPGQTNRVCRDLTQCSPSQYISNPGRANNEDVVCLDCSGVDNAPPTYSDIYGVRQSNYSCTDIGDTRVTICNGMFHLSELSDDSLPGGPPCRVNSAPCADNQYNAVDTPGIFDIQCVECPAVHDAPTGLNNLSCNTDFTSGECHDSNGDVISSTGKAECESNFGYKWVFHAGPSFIQNCDDGYWRDRDSSGSISDQCRPCTPIQLYDKTIVDGQETITLEADDSGNVTCTTDNDSEYQIGNTCPNNYFLVSKGTPVDGIPSLNDMCFSCGSIYNIDDEAIVTCQTPDPVSLDRIGNGANKRINPSGTSSEQPCGYINGNRGMVVLDSSGDHSCVEPSCDDISFYIDIDGTSGIAGGPGCQQCPSIQNLREDEDSNVVPRCDNSDGSRGWNIRTGAYCTVSVMDGDVAIDENTECCGEGKSYVEDESADDPTVKYGRCVERGYTSCPVLNYLDNNRCYSCGDPIDNCEDNVCDDPALGITCNRCSEYYHLSGNMNECILNTICLDEDKWRYIIDDQRMDSLREGVLDNIINEWNKLPENIKSPDEPSRETMLEDLKYFRPGGDGINDINCNTFSTCNNGYENPNNLPDERYNDINNCGNLDIGSRTPSEFLTTYESDSGFPPISKKTYYMRDHPENSESSFCIGPNDGECVAISRVDGSEEVIDNSTLNEIFQVMDNRNSDRFVNLADYRRSDDFVNNTWESGTCSNENYPTEAECMGGYGGLCLEIGRTNNIDNNGSNILFNYEDHQFTWRKYDNCREMEPSDTQSEICKNALNDYFGVAPAEFLNKRKEIKENCLYAPAPSDSRKCEFVEDISCSDCCEITPDGNICYGASVDSEISCNSEKNGGGKMSGIYISDCGINFYKGNEAGSGVHGKCYRRNIHSDNDWVELTSPQTPDPPQTKEACANLDGDFGKETVWEQIHNDECIERRQCPYGQYISNSDRADYGVSDNICEYITPCDFNHYNKNPPGLPPDCHPATDCEGTSGGKKIIGIHWRDATPYSEAQDNICIDRPKTCGDIYGDGGFSTGGNPVQFKCGFGPHGDLNPIEYENTLSKSDTTPRTEDRSASRSEGYQKDWGIGGDGPLEHLETLHGVDINMDTVIKEEHNPGAVTDIFNLSHESYVKGSGGTCLTKDGVVVPPAGSPGSDLTVPESGTVKQRKEDCLSIQGPDGEQKYRWRKSDRVRGNINKPDDSRPLNVAQDFCEEDFSMSGEQCRGGYNSGMLEQDDEGRTFNPTRSDSMHDWWKQTWKLANSSALTPQGIEESDASIQNMRNELYSRIPSNDIMNYNLEGLDQEIKDYASKSLWEGGRPLEHLYNVVGVPGRWNPSGKFPEFEGDKLGNYSRTYYNPYLSLGEDSQVIPDEITSSNPSSKNEWDLLNQTGGGPIVLEGSLYYKETPNDDQHLGSWWIDKEGIIDSNDPGENSSLMEIYKEPSEDELQASGVENMRIDSDGNWVRSDPTDNWSKNKPEVIVENSGNKYGTDFSRNSTTTEMMNDMICPEGGCIPETCCRSRPKECSITQTMKNAGITDDIFSSTEISTDDDINGLTQESCGICVKKKTEAILGRCDSPNHGIQYTQMPNANSKHFRINNDKLGCGEAQTVTLEQLDDLSSISAELDLSQGFTIDVTPILDKPLHYNSSKEYWRGLPKQNSWTDQNYGSDTPPSCPNPNETGIWGQSMRFAWDPPQNERMDWDTGSEDYWLPAYPIHPRGANPDSIPLDNWTLKWRHFNDAYNNNLGPLPSQTYMNDELELMDTLQQLCDSNDQSVIGGWSSDSGETNPLRYLDDCDHDILRERPPGLGGAPVETGFDYPVIINDNEEWVKNRRTLINNWETMGDSRTLYDLYYWGIDGASRDRMDEMFVGFQLTQKPDYGNNENIFGHTLVNMDNWPTPKSKVNLLNNSTNYLNEDNGCYLEKIENTCAGKCLNGETYDINGERYECKYFTIGNDKIKSLTNEEKDNIDYCEGSVGDNKCSDTIKELFKKDSKRDVNYDSDENIIKLTDYSSTSCKLHYGKVNEDKKENINWKKSGNTNEWCGEIKNTEPHIDEQWNCYVSGGNWIAPEGTCYGEKENYKYHDEYTIRNLLVKKYIDDNSILVSDDGYIDTPAEERLTPEEHWAINNYPVNGIPTASQSDPTYSILKRQDELFKQYKELAMHGDECGICSEPGNYAYKTLIKEYDGNNNQSDCIDNGGEWTNIIWKPGIIDIGEPEWNYDNPHTKYEKWRISSRAESKESERVCSGATNNNYCMNMIEDLKQTKLAEAGRDDSLSDTFTEEERKTLISQCNSDARCTWQGKCYVVLEYDENGDPLYNGEITNDKSEFECYNNNSLIYDEETQKTVNTTEWVPNSIDTDSCLSSEMGKCNDQGMKGMSHLLGSLKGLPGTKNVGRTLAGCGNRNYEDDGTLYDNSCYGFAGVEQGIINENNSDSEFNVNNINGIGDCKSDESCILSRSSNKEDCEEGSYFGEEQYSYEYLSTGISHEDRKNTGKISIGERSNDYETYITTKSVNRNSVVGGRIDQVSENIDGTSHTYYEPILARSTIDSKCYNYPIIDKKTIYTAKNLIEQTTITPPRDEFIFNFIHTSDVSDDVENGCVIAPTGRWLFWNIDNTGSPECYNYGLDYDPDKSELTGTSNTDWWKRIRNIPDKKWSWNTLLSKNEQSIDGLRVDRRIGASHLAQSENAYGVYRTDNTSGIELFISWGPSTMPFPLLNDGSGGNPAPIIDSEYRTMGYKAVYIQNTENITTQRSNGVSIVKGRRNYTRNSLTLKERFRAPADRRTWISWSNDVLCKCGERAPINQNSINPLEDDKNLCKVVGCDPGAIDRLNTAGFFSDKRICSGINPNKLWEIFYLSQDSGEFGTGGGWTPCPEPGDTLDWGSLALCGNPYSDREGLSYSGDWRDWEMYGLFTGRGRGLFARDRGVNEETGNAYDYNVRGILDCTPFGQIRGDHLATSSSLLPGLATSRNGSQINYLHGEGYYSERTNNNDDPLDNLSSPPSSISLPFSSPEWESPEVWSQMPQDELYNFTTALRMHTLTVGSGGTTDSLVMNTDPINTINNMAHDVFMRDPYYGVDGWAEPGIVCEDTEVPGGTVCTKPYGSMDIKVQSTLTQSFWDFNKLPGQIILNQLSKWDLDPNPEERIGYRDMNVFRTDHASMMSDKREVRRYLNSTTGYYGDDDDDGKENWCKPYGFEQESDDYLRTIKMGGPNIPEPGDIHIITLNQLRCININDGDKNCKLLEDETRDIIKDLLIWEFIDSKYVSPVSLSDINIIMKQHMCKLSDEEITRKEFRERQGLYNFTNFCLDSSLCDEDEGSRDIGPTSHKCFNDMEYNIYDGYDISESEFELMKQMTRSFGLCWISFWINKYDPSKVWFCDKNDLSGKPPIIGDYFPGSLDGENINDWVFQPLDIEARKYLDNTNINDIIRDIKPDPLESVEVNKFFPNERDGNRWWHDIRGRLAKRSPLFMDETGNAIISEGYKEPGKLDILNILVDGKTSAEYYQYVKAGMIPDYSKFYPPDHCYTLPFSDLDYNMKMNPTSMCPGRAPLTVLQVLNNILPCHLYNYPDMNYDVSSEDPVLTSDEENIIKSYAINNGGTFKDTPSGVIFGSEDTCCVCENKNKESGYGGIGNNVREWTWLPGIWQGRAISPSGKEYTDREKDIITCENSDNPDCEEYYSSVCHVGKWDTPETDAATNTLRENKCNSMDGCEIFETDMFKTCIATENKGGLLIDYSDNRFIDGDDIALPEWDRNVSSDIHDWQTRELGSEETPVWGCLHPITNEIWSVKQRPGDMCVWREVDGLEDVENTPSEMIKYPSEERPKQYNDYGYGECHKISSDIENEIDRSGCKRSQPGDDWTLGSEWCGDDEGICVRFLKVNNDDGGWSIEGDFGEYLGGAGGGGYGSDPGFESEEECLSHPWCTGIWGTSDIEIEDRSCDTFNGDQTTCDNTPYCYYQGTDNTCIDKDYSPEGLKLKGSLIEHLFPGKCVYPIPISTASPGIGDQILWDDLDDANHRLRNIGDPVKCFEEAGAVWKANDPNYVRDAHEKFGHVHPTIIKYYDEESGAKNSDLDDINWIQRGESGTQLEPLPPVVEYPLSCECFLGDEDSGSCTGRIGGTIQYRSSCINNEHCWMPTATGLWGSGPHDWPKTHPLCADTEIYPADRNPGTEVEQDPLEVTFDFPDYNPSWNRSWPVPSWYTRGKTEDEWESYYDIYGTMNEEKRDTLWNGSPGVQFGRTETPLPFLPNTQRIDLQEGSALTGIPQIGTYGWNPDEPVRNMGWASYLGTAWAYNPDIYDDSSAGWNTDWSGFYTNSNWNDISRILGGNGDNPDNISTAGGEFWEMGHPEYPHTSAGDSRIPVPGHPAIQEFPYNPNEDTFMGGGLREEDQFVSIHHEDFAHDLQYTNEEMDDANTAIANNIPQIENLKLRTDLQIPRKSGGIYDPSTSNYGKYSNDIDLRNYHNKGDDQYDKAVAEGRIDALLANIHRTGISLQNDLIYPGSSDWGWGCKWIKNPGSSRVRHSEQFNILMEKCTQYGTCRWNPVCSEDPQDYRWESLTSNWVPKHDDVNKYGICRSGGYCRSIPEIGPGGDPVASIYYDTIKTKDECITDSSKEWIMTSNEYIDVDNETDCADAGGTWFNPGEEEISKPIRTIDESDIRNEENYNFGRQEKMAGAGGYGGIKVRGEYETYSKDDDGRIIGSVHNIHEPSYSGGLDFHPDKTLRSDNGDGGFLPGWRDGHWGSACGTDSESRDCIEGFTSDMYNPKDICYHPQDEFERTQYSSCNQYLSPTQDFSGDIDTSENTIRSMRSADCKDSGVGYACGMASDESEEERDERYRTTLKGGRTALPQSCDSDAWQDWGDEAGSTIGWNANCTMGGGFNFVGRRPGADELQEKVLRNSINVYDGHSQDDFSDILHDDTHYAGMMTYRRAELELPEPPDVPQHRSVDFYRDAGINADTDSFRTGANEEFLGAKEYSTVNVMDPLEAKLPRHHNWISGEEGHWHASRSRSGGHPNKERPPPQDYWSAFIDDTVGWSVPQHRSDYLPPHLWSSWNQNANVTYDQEACSIIGEDAPCTMLHPFFDVETYGENANLENRYMLYQDRFPVNYVPIYHINPDDITYDSMYVASSPQTPYQESLRIPPGDFSSLSTISNYPEISLKYQESGKFKPGHCRSCRHASSEYDCRNIDGCEWNSVSGTCRARNCDNIAPQYWTNLSGDTSDEWSSRNIFDERSGIPHHVLTGGTSHFSEDTGVPADELLLDGLRGRSVNRWDAECNWVDKNGNLIDVQRAGERGSYVYCSDENAVLHHGKSINDKEVSDFIDINAIPYPKWNEREKLSEWALLPYMGDPDQALQFQWNPSTWRAGIFHPGIPSDPGLGEANGMGDSSLFGYTKGGMKRYENRLLWEVTENKLDSYDPILKDRVLNKRHGESMMSDDISSTDALNIVDPKGPTTRSWKMQNKPNPYGNWKNCCLPEPRGIWQKDLPPIPPAVGRVWEGTGVSKIRSENESGWTVDSYNNSELAGVDYIGRTCDVISSDAYDTFIGGKYGPDEKAYRTVYRYEGADSGTLYKRTPEDYEAGNNVGVWMSDWNITDNYDSSIDTTVDYDEPKGDFLKIWNKEYIDPEGPQRSLLSDRDRFTNECIESDCSWLSSDSNSWDGKKGGQCVDRIILNGIITFEHVGNLETGSSIHSSLLSNGCGSSNNAWVWKQLDSKPGRADKGWFVDIEPSIKYMIKKFFRENDVEISNQDIIINNTMVTSDNLNVMGDASCGYTRDSNKHPIMYKLDIPCKSNMSTEDCIEEYKTVQKKFTYSCENGDPRVSIVAKREGVLHSLYDFPEDEFPDWRPPEISSPPPDPPIIKWETLPTENYLKTCYHTKHNCKYHEKNITLGKQGHLFDLHGDMVPCSGSSDNDMLELCTDDECCTRDVVYCHEGEDINDPEGRYNKSLDVTTTDNRSIVGSITLESYKKEDGTVQAGIPRSGLTDDEAQALRDEYFRLETEFNYQRSLGIAGDSATATANFKNFIKEYGLCRRHYHPGRAPGTTHPNGVARTSWATADSRHKNSSVEVTCSWDLGYTHIGGLVVGKNKWNDINEQTILYGSYYGCPSKSSDWSIEGVEEAPGWSTEDGGVEFEGGYCMETENDDIDDYGTGVLRTFLNKSKAECVDEGHFWKHGPILCGATPTRFHHGEPPVYTGYGNDMCNAATRPVYPYYFTYPPTCTPNPEHSTNNDDCNSLNEQMKSFVGRSFSGLGTAASLCRELEESGICIYNSPYAKYEGVEENNVCQLGICAPEECLYPGIDGYPDDCKVRGGKHTSLSETDNNYYYMTNDIETNYQTNDKYKNTFSTCETEDYNCNTDLSNTSEQYSSTSKECFNHIMRSSNWAGGGDNINKLSSEYSNGYEYLSGCDGMSTEPSHKSERIVQPCKSLSDLNGIEPNVLDSLAPEIKDKPRCFDEENLLINSWKTTSIVPFNQQLLIPNTCCEPVVNEKCDTYEGGGLCFKNLSSNSWDTESSGGDISRDEYHSREACEGNIGNNKWASGCYKSKLYWSSSYPTARIYDFDRNWVRDFVMDPENGLDPYTELSIITKLLGNNEAIDAVDTDTHSGDRYADAVTNISTIANPLDPDKIEFWEKEHPPRMIYDSSKWLGTNRLNGNGYEKWMDKYDDDDFINPAKFILNKIKNKKFNHNISDINNQNNDTWREGPCRFACANYRAERTLRANSPPSSCSVNSVNGRTECDSPIFDWPDDAGLNTDTTSEISNEMRDRCNSCLGYQTIK